MCQAVTSGQRDAVRIITRGRWDCRGIFCPHQGTVLIIFARRVDVPHQRGDPIRGRGKILTRALDAISFGGSTTSRFEGHGRNSMGFTSRRAVLALLIGLVLIAPRFASAANLYASTATGAPGELYTIS